MQFSKALLVSSERYAEETTRAPSDKSGFQRIEDLYLLSGDAHRDVILWIGAGLFQGDEHVVRPAHASRNGDLFTL